MAAAKKDEAGGPIGAGMQQNTQGGFATRVPAARAESAQSGLLAGTPWPHFAEAASSRVGTGAMAWNTPSRRTSRWSKAAAMWSRTSAKNAKAR
jgi:hypothetical protein